MSRADGNTERRKRKLSAEWNDRMLDDILSDVERMTRERSEADAGADKPMHAWTLGEVDALLDEDNALAGFGRYEFDPVFPDTVRPRKPAEPEYTEPVYTEPVYTEPAYTEPAYTEPETPEPIYTKPVEPELKQSVAEPQDDGGKTMTFTRPVPQKMQDVPQPERTAEEPPKKKTRVMDAVEQTAAAPTKEKTRVMDAVEQAVAAPQKPKPRPKKSDPEMVDGQMMLTGFDEEDDVEQVDEAEAEKELHERRKKQVKKFQLYDFAEKYEPDLPPKPDVFDPEPEPSAGSETPDENEYECLSDRLRIGRILQKERRSAFRSVCMLAVTTVVLIVLSAIAGKADPEAGQILYAVSLVLLSLSAAVSMSTYRKGLFDLIRWNPSCDSAVLLATAGALVQGIVSIFLPVTEPASGTFCAAVAFSLLLCRIAKLFETVGIVGNFKFCAFTSADRLHAIRAFDRESDAFEIGKVLDVNRPKLRFSQKTRFPAQFRKYADFRTATDRLCRILLPAGLGAAVIMALTGWLRTDPEAGALAVISNATSAFAGTLCIALPVGAAFTVIVPIVLLMQNLNRRGGMIASPEAARENADVDAVAVDAVDLYDSKKTDVYCFQDYGTLYFDAMYLYAAALAIGAHSPAESAFLHAVGNPDILPPVQSLIYEERLGVSATIERRSVLLGNRNLLINHSIDPPPKSGEVPYLQQNKRVLYLAVDGKVAGMFVIDYVQKTALSVPLRILQNNDTNLIAYAPDCNVTEDFISANFRLRAGGVRLLDPAAGKLLRERLAETTEHMPATALHNGTTESLMRTLADAAVMQNIQRIAAFIGVIGCGIGWLVSFILLLIVGSGAMNWIFATVYPAVWMALSAALGIWQARKAMK